MADCIFCKIAAGDIPAQVVWQDEHAVAFRDIRPQAPVHVVFIPRRHVVSFAHVTSADGPFLGSLGVGLRAVAEAEGIAETGFRVLSNNGPHGGQEVAHLHVHLLGGRPLGPMLRQEVGVSRSAGTRGSDEARRRIP
ncbi:MAG: histidine triad nucleotide-binding protein [Deltaproteobacteria bacterium]|nr:histidine triad nucleotide-binding protein [Deltaproteobacteria bacterium]